MSFKRAKTIFDHWTTIWPKPLENHQYQWSISEKNIQWWWLRGSKTIEKPLIAMVPPKKFITIPSLWKNDHRWSLYGEIQITIMILKWRKVLSGIVKKTINIMRKRFKVKPSCRPRPGSWSCKASTLTPSGSWGGACRPLRPDILCHTCRYIYNDPISW